MKKEILCIDCNRETSGINLRNLLITAEDVEEAGGAIISPPPIPEEVRKVGGKALIQLRCDICNRVIEEGEYCVARSTIGYGQTYSPWELKYIK